MLTLAFLGNSFAFAATGGELLNLKMILSGPAIFSLVTFVVAYFFVMTEEFSHLRKANLKLIGRMEEHHMTLAGESNGSSTSVRALIYILAGHLQHHMGILVERYKL